MVSRPKNYSFICFLIFQKNKIGTNQNFGCEFVRWSVDDKNVNLLENMWIVLHHKNFTLTSRSRVHYNKFTLLWPFVNLLCLSCLLLDEVSQIHFNKFTNYVNNFTLTKWWLQITCVLSYCHIETCHLSLWGINSNNPQIQLPLPPSSLMYEVQTQQLIIGIKKLLYL